MGKGCIKGREKGNKRAYKRERNGKRTYKRESVCVWGGGVHKGSNQTYLGPNTLYRKCIKFALKRGGAVGRWSDPPPSHPPTPTPNPLSRPPEKGGDRGVCSILKREGGYLLNGRSLQYYISYDREI